ncbi:MAG: hypothetical protein WC568_05870 [Candidatus Methanoperedens sp.]
MNNRNIFLIIFIILIFIQFFTLSGQASINDISLNNYIYKNISSYSIIEHKYKLINATSFDVTFVYIKKMQNNSDFPSSINYATDLENVLIKNISIFKFDENGKIIKNYVVNYKKDFSKINISTDFQSGYNAVIMEFIFSNEKNPPTDRQRYNIFTRIRQDINLDSNIFYRSFEFEIPTPNSHNLDMTPVYFLSDGDKQIFIPISSIKFGDTSTNVRFILKNSVFQPNVIGVPASFDFDFINNTNIKKATFETRFSYEPITNYDIIYTVIYSFFSAIFLGFIFFLLEWRKFGKKEK